MIVLIDNGHGVNTRGKCSPDGRFMEWEWTRAIARGVVTVLKAKGIDARLLVPENADIALRERCNRANAVCSQVGASKVCLVSIHANAAGSDGKWHNATGWEAWTSPGQTQGDRLADCLYDAAEESLPDLFPGVPGFRLIRTDLTDGDRDKEAKFTILTGTRCAACLTENFFQDSRQNVDWLLSQDGRSAIVDIHVRGILKYIDKYGKK